MRLNKMINNPLLTVKNLNKFFNEQQVLHDISFSLQRGEILFYLVLQAVAKLHYYVPLQDLNTPILAKFG